MASRRQSIAGAAMRPQLTHLALHVRDLDAMVDFYGNYCDLTVVHDRRRDGGHVVWLAEAGREEEFVIVLIDGGPGRDQIKGDISHFGFALESREAVDVAAARADSAGQLMWPTREEPYPVGYYCGLRDPDGNCVELSYGQPLGPGAPSTAAT